MAYEEILYGVGDKVATVTLNRPDRLNAWTSVMKQEVRTAMAEAAGDDAVRVIVLTGAGRGFCAGADMSLLSSVDNQTPEQRAEAAKKGMMKRVVVHLTDGSSHTFEFGLLSVKNLVAAVNEVAAGAAGNGG